MQTPPRTESVPATVGRILFRHSDTGNAIPQKTRKLVSHLPKSAALLVGM